jgi:hypothetical protein
MYYRNGNLLRIAPAAPNLPLVVDVSIRDIDGTVSSAVIANYNDGSFTAQIENAGDNPVFQWYLNGNPVGDNAPNYSNPDLMQGDVLSCEVSPDLGGCSSTTYTSNSINLILVQEPASISFFISSGPTSAACQLAREDVSWDANQIENLEITANGLLKIQSNGNWNGAAFSLNSLVDNGYFEFTATETNRQRMVGLSHTNAGSGFGGIDFAIYLNNSNLRIYENGQNRGSFGNYQSGDIFRIAVEDGAVVYYRNGNAFYTSNQTPTLPLYADISIRDIGGTVTNPQILNPNEGSFTANAEAAGDNPSLQWYVNGFPAGTNSPSFEAENYNPGDVVTCVLTPDIGGCFFTDYISNEIIIEPSENTPPSELIARVVPGGSDLGYALEDVVWNTSNTVGSTENDISKFNSDQNWDGGAVSLNAVYASGYFQFYIAETNTNRFVGLSSLDGGNDQNSIQYAFSLEADGSLRIVESGTDRGSFGTYSNGDSLRISLEGGSIRYIRNNNLLYTSTLAPTSPLFADVSIFDVGGTVTDAVVGNLTDGSFTVEVQNAGVNPSYQWRLNGWAVGANAPNYSNPFLVDGDIITCDITPDFEGCFSEPVTSNTIVIDGPPTVTVWSGLINNNWHLSGNWTEGVPDETMTAIIPQGSPNHPLVSSLAAVRSLNIDAGAQVDFGTATMQVYENLTVEGSLNHGNGSFAFLGTELSTISGNGSLVPINRLVINKSFTGPGLVLNDQVSISNETVFIQGLIDASSNEIIFLNDAESRTGLNESHIEGTVIKRGDDPFTFPVGANGIYAPIGISAPDQVNTEFAATYYNEDPNSAGFTTSERDPDLLTLSSCEYWILDRNAGTSAVFVTLSYENVRSCGTAAPEDLRISRWNGDSWQNHGYLEHLGDALAGTVTSAEPIEEFSPFTFGSGSFNNPLPVELLSFEAEVFDQRKVELAWETATETNNDFFTIEKSRDGIHFELVGYVQGAGTSPNGKRYKLTDTNPYSGLSYYRLTQTDFNGASETFPVRAVEVRPEYEVSVFPNPNNGNFSINVLGHNADILTFRLLSGSGRIVWETTADQALIQASLSGTSPGLYILEILDTGGNKQHQKVIIQ